MITELLLNLVVTYAKQAHRNDFDIGGAAASPAPRFLRAWKIYHLKANVLVSLCCSFSLLYKMTNLKNRFTFKMTVAPPPGVTPVLCGTTLCHFLGYFFIRSSGFMGIVLEKFPHLSVCFWGISGFMGIRFEKLSASNDGNRRSKLVRTVNHFLIKTR